MSYSTSAPPVLIAKGVGGTGAQLWSYRTEDGAAATVDASGYITNATELGMRVGDLVQLVDTNASPVAGILATVNEISSTYPGAADLQDTATATTDSD